MRWWATGIGLRISTGTTSPLAVGNSPDSTCELLARVPEMLQCQPMRVRLATRGGFSCMRGMPIITSATIAAAGRIDRG